MPHQQFLPKQDPTRKSYHLSMNNRGFILSPVASIPCRKGSTRTGSKYDPATDSGMSIRVRSGFG
jgi:hypothetical protein